MADKYEFRTAKDFCAFLEQNCSDYSKIYVKEVYNLGDGQYSHSPLFLYSGYSIIMAWLSKEGLSLKIYDKDFFIQNIRAGIFRESPDSEEIYRVSFPNAKLINSFVEEIDVKESEDGTVGKITLVFKNGIELNAEPSSSLSGTMNSYIYV